MAVFYLNIIQTQTAIKYVHFIITMMRVQINISVLKA